VWHKALLECVWNVMAHAQKPDFAFRRNGRVHLNRRGRQFSRLLAAELCASAVVMLDTPCSEIVWRVLATHSIRQFPLYFPSRASLCAITFQLDSTISLFRKESEHLSRFNSQNEYILISDENLTVHESKFLYRVCGNASQPTPEPPRILRLGLPYVLHSKLHF
jgi:hypothetical protein